MIAPVRGDRLMLNQGGLAEELAEVKALCADMRTAAYAQPQEAMVRSRCSPARLRPLGRR